MDYIDLKQDLKKEILDIKSDIVTLTQNYQFFLHKLPSTLQQKNISDKVYNLDLKLNKLLTNLEKVEVHTIDSDIHNGIIELDELLDYRFKNKLFSNSEALKNIFSSNIRDFYFKSELSLDEIFGELKLSINICSNINNLTFEVYGHNSKLTSSNNLIQEITNNDKTNKSATKIINPEKRRNENDRELYTR